MTGAIAAGIGSILLIILVWGEQDKMLSLGVFGVSLIALFTVSALFHGIKLPEEKRMWLNRLDHGAIFLLIAGTYTPIVVILYPSEWRAVTLIVIWSAAILGISFKLISRQIHGLLNASIYPIISWAGVIPALLIGPIRAVFLDSGLWLIALGGMVYMAGFFIYFFQKPDPWPDKLGHHEIWHLFVIGGALCHYLYMVLYIVPYQA